MFWNNEELRSRQLASMGVLETNWARVGFRSREFIINTNLLPKADAPSSLLELTNPVFRGRLALAYPLFGTTATHFMALRQVWGEPGWRQWCEALTANQPLLVEGNSVVVRMVAQGEAWIGLTDSDDIRAGLRQGWPVRAVSFRESLRIPNSVVRVRGGPNVSEAGALIEYLSGSRVTDELVKVGALQSAVWNSGAETLEPDWGVVLREMDSAIEELKRIFLR